MPDSAEDRHSQQRHPPVGTQRLGGDGNSSPPTSPRYPERTVTLGVIPRSALRAQLTFAFLLSPYHPGQDIAKDFPKGEESLDRLKEQAEGVIRNTSPLGAEKISVELEEMQGVLEKLRVLWKEEEGRLQGLLQSKGACGQQILQLEAELGEFKKSLQRLAHEGLEPTVKTATEDELVAQWRLFSVSSGVQWTSGCHLESLCDRESSSALCMLSGVSVLSFGT